MGVGLGVVTANLHEDALKPEIELAERDRWRRAHARFECIPGGVEFATRCIAVVPRVNPLIALAVQRKIRQRSIAREGLRRCPEGQGAAIACRGRLRNPRSRLGGSRERALGDKEGQGQQKRRRCTIAARIEKHGAYSRAEWCVEDAALGASARLDSRTTGLVSRIETRITGNATLVGR